MEKNELGYKNNINLYKKYKMFSYDWLFFSAISVLYYTVTKGLSMAEVMYVTAAFSLFAFIWQMPSNFIIEKLGLRKSTILGNILVCIEVFMYIFAPNMYVFMIADFIGSLGWAIKGITEGSILYVSLKKLGRKDEFSKIEGKSNSKYYYYDAISAALSGFLFLINNYIPMILCFLNTVVSTVLSFKFTEVENENDEEKVTMKDITKQFIDILYSKRSKSLFIFAFIFAGIVGASQKLYNSILIDLKLPEQYITIVLSIVTIFTGIGAKYSYKVQNMSKNKTLTLFTIIYIISMFFIGLIGLVNKLNLFTLSTYMLLLTCMCFIQGSYRVALKKYILNFTNHTVRTKVTALYYLFEYIGKVVLIFLCGLLLEVFNNSISTILFTIVVAILCYLCIKYMKGKLGLEPEEYDKSEIYDYVVKK